MGQVVNRAGEPAKTRLEPQLKAGSVASRFLGHAESIVLAMVAIVLVALAVMLLLTSVVALVQALLQGKVRDQAIDILDTILLVMMTMEIVYTVVVSLESHSLVGEPFLIIGAIAAIRRMLVITAETTKLETENPDAFRSVLIELGLLAVIVIAMALSVYVLRRSEHFLPPHDDIDSSQEQT